MASDTKLLICFAFFWVVSAAVIYVRVLEQELLLRPAPVGIIVKMIDSAGLQGTIVVYHLRTVLIWVTVMKSLMEVISYVLGIHYWIAH